MSKENLRTLLKISKQGVWITYFSMAILLLLPTLIWLVPSIAQSEWIQFVVRPSASLDWNYTTRQKVWLIAMLPVSIQIWGLWQIVIIFKRIEKGEVISHTIANCIFRLGYAMIAMAFAIPVSRLMILHELASDKKNDLMILGIFTPGLVFCAFLSLGVTITALASVVREAVRVEEENKSFI